MTEPLVIIGCGGLGREFHDVVDAVNAIEPTWDLLGYLDDAPTEENIALVEERGSRVLGGVDHLAQLPTNTHAIIGIGDGPVRARIAARAAEYNRPAATVVHPTATRGFGVHLGAGSVVAAGVHLTTNITVGAHTVLNLGITIGHDTIVGEYVTINPNASVSGSCVIGDRVLIGTGAIVMQGRRIGADARIGASACVTSDIAEDVTAVGVPARALVARP